MFERDGERCTYVDQQGRRCEARTLLELDHVKPRALGGTDDVDNLCVKCRCHNGLAAEHAFGRAHVEKKKAEKKNRPRQRGSEDDVALRALCGVGFKDAEARRALVEGLAMNLADRDRTISQASLRLIEHRTFGPRRGLTDQASFAQRRPVIFRRKPAGW